MSATAEQMASLYEGRYNEVVFHADVYFPFSDWGAPPSQFLLVAMIAKEAAQGKGFYDACLKSLGAHKLSADHIFKIAKKCTVKIDHHFEKLFESAYFVLNELGMVLAWRFLEDASIPSDLLEELSQRPNMFVEEVHSDRCCGEVLVWQKYFPDAHLCLDLFHAIQRVVREISKKKKGRPGDLVVALWYHITTNPQKLSLCPMCMSSYLQKPIRMHALTCCKDMRHHKQPQRPRGWPGAFAFFKIFECIWTNLYTTSPVAIPFSACPRRRCATRLARAPGSIPATGAILQRAPAQAEFYCLQQYFAGDLCHQDFPGILCHQEFFPRRFVSIEWQPNP